MNRTSTIIGKHRSKIGAMQMPSPATIEAADTLNWHALGPGDLAVSEWQAAGLELPDLTHIRRYRLGRVRQYLRQFDYAGIVLFDPLNVRYATDSTNMQVWVMHNAARYVFVPTEGPVVMFDDPDMKFLNDHSEVIDEVRAATCWYYFSAGKGYFKTGRR